MSDAMREALELAEEALASCYQVTEWPANGESSQDYALAAVRRALSAPDGWRPIEEAPRDGTVILLFAEGCVADGTGIVKGRWYVHPAIQDWITDEFDCGDFDFAPTAWQPLPAPPKQGQSDTEGGR